MVFRQNEDTILNLHITPEAPTNLAGASSYALVGMDNIV